MNNERIKILEFIKLTLAEAGRQKKEHALAEAEKIPDFIPFLGINDFNEKDLTSAVICAECIRDANKIEKAVSFIDEEINKIIEGNKNEAI